jgi:hypothetical protein
MLEYAIERLDCANAWQALRVVAVVGKFVQSSAADMVTVVTSAIWPAIYRHKFLAKQIENIICGMLGRRRHASVMLPTLEQTALGEFVLVVTTH